MKQIVKRIQHLVWYGMGSLAILGLLAGCATTFIPLSQDTVQTRTLSPDDNSALVYFFYDKLSLKPTNVTLNGIGSEIKKGRYVVWDIAPGNYELVFTYQANKLSEIITEAVTLQAGHVSYFKMTGNDRDTHNIVEIDAAAGQSMLQEYHVIGWFEDGVSVLNATTAQAPIMPSHNEFPPSDEDSKKPQTEIIGQYHALMIGLSVYQYLEPVATAVHDTRSIARLLHDEYGFDVQTVFDQQATRTTILDALNTLRDVLTPDDKLLIYYAGRCVRDDDTQTTYWLPFDAEWDTETQWIMTDVITANLKRIPANQILIVADSCYGDALVRARNADLLDPDKRISYLQKSQEIRSRMLMLSGTRLPVPEEGGQEHSLFAQTLLNALERNTQQIITTEELFFGAILEPIAGASEYLPELKAIRNSGHQGGDFIFRKK